MREKVTFRNIWGIISPMLVYFLLQIVIVNLGYLFIYTVCSIRLQGSTLQMIEQTARNIYMNYVLHLNVIAGMIAVPIFIFWYYRDYTKSFLKGIQKKYEMVNPLKYSFIAFFGFFTMLAANYFVSLLMQFMPDFMLRSYDDMDEIISSASLVVQFILAAIIAPIVEELIFRGLVYSKIRRMSNVKAAAVLAALLFGIYHRNWIQAPYAFLLGLAAAFVYEKYKSILAPILLHASANLISMLITYFVSGSDAGSVQELPKSTTVAVLFMLTVFMTGFVALFGVIIQLTVKPKEVSNEVIDDYNSML